MNFPGLVDYKSYAEILPERNKKKCKQPQDLLAFEYGERMLHNDCLVNRLDYSCNILTIDDDFL
jgi:hypothetical protein